MKRAVPGKLVIGSCAAALALAAAWSAAADRIGFLDRVESARALAQRDGRPIVLQFGASWCGWCRKMEYETLANAEVVEAAKRFHWVKVDVDEQPVVAALHGVRGVPRTIVTGPRGAPLASQGGFLAPDRMIAVLDDALAAAAEAERGRDPDAPPPGAGEAAQEMVAALASPLRAGRAERLDAVRELGPEAWPVLLELMGHERLAYRAASAHALAHATRAGLAFDPFAALTDRTKQIDAWRGWVEKNRPAPIAVPPPPTDGGA